MKYNIINPSNPITRTQVLRTTISVVLTGMFTDVDFPEFTPPAGSGPIMSIFFDKATSTLILEVGREIPLLTTNWSESTLSLT
jgi:hypothetical protein